MLELLLCSLLTIFPDYLYRRYAQGKRLGKEITFYSVWFELRWGITTCLILTVSLITVIFYNHPSTDNATEPIVDTNRGLATVLICSSPNCWPRPCRKAGRLSSGGGGGAEAPTFMTCASICPKPA